MPGFDGTGSMGRGPRTGGGRGYCAPVAGQYAYNAPVVYGVGRGGTPWGGGRGFLYGGGCGRRFWRQWGTYPTPEPAQMSIQDELAMLEEQAQWMEEQLAQIKTRVEELKQK